MELQAYPKTIKDILDINKKYIIPRFQREFSWEKNEIQEFLTDTYSQISFNEDKTYTNNDYFIGSIVLIGKDKDNEFLVVDGQQRITTITIIFSVLTQIFKSLNNNDLVQSCFSYIEGRDDDSQRFLKLQNESPMPFFQQRIQNIEINTSLIPISDEEKRLFDAYNYVYAEFQENKLLKHFKGIDTYTDILKSIRDQIKKFQVIYITVSTLDDANKIFETLNAKGKDLETIDLIKNEVFKVLDDTHPTDMTKDKWKKIKSILKEREKSEKASVFLRHFWLSKYCFVRNTEIYDSFKSKIIATRENYQVFLSDLENSANWYKKIISPVKEDWRRNEKKSVYDSLIALTIFDISQVRTILLALLEKNESSSNILKHGKLINFLNLLENFHFIFTAIVSSRASALENLYSKFAIKIRKCYTTEEMNHIFNGLKKELERLLPDYETFENNFFKKEYTNSKNKHRQLINYIIRKYDSSFSDTNEYIIEDMSIEHISDQKDKIENYGCIGNLLPLSQQINSDIPKDSSYKDKLKYYRKSNFLSIIKFVNENENMQEWTTELINARTRLMANEAYYKVWKL